MPLISLSRLLVIVAFLCACLMPLTGATADEWDDCESDDPDRSISACSRIIQRGDRETKKDLADANFHIGNAYYDKENYKVAISHYDEAIRLNPSDKEAIKARDDAYRERSANQNSATTAVPAPSCPAGYSLSGGQCISNSARASSGSIASSSGPWVFIVNLSLGVKSALDLDGANVCLVPGSASQAAAAGYFQTNRINFSAVRDNTIDAAIGTYDKSACDVLVVEERAANVTIGRLRRPNDHGILPERIGGSAGSSPLPVRRAAPAPPSPVNLAFPLQSELERIGCLTGRVDGVWGSGSRAALRRFSNQAGLRLGSEPSQNALDEAKSTDSRYCTPVRAAPKRKKPKGCRSGTVFLDGQCIRRSEVAEFCGPGFERSGSRCVPMKADREQPAVRKKARCSSIKFAFTRGNSCACSGGRIFTGSACVKRRQSGGSQQTCTPGQTRKADGCRFQCVCTGLVTCNWVADVCE